MAKWTLVAALVACGKDQPEPPPRQMPVMAEPDAAPPPADASEVAAVQVPVTQPARKPWTTRIGDAATFDQYSQEIGGERFTKLVIDPKTDAVFYFDVDLMKLHKDFLPKTKPKPELLACTLVHHLATDTWTFSLEGGGDPAYASQRIRETFYLGDKVTAETNAPEMPAYVAFEPGHAVGTLRIGGDKLAPGDIVVLKKPVADITPVAGIISERSTAISPVNLRARMWGIPSIGLRDAAAKLKAFAGKQVYFEAKAAGYELREATADELAAKPDEATVGDAAGALAEIETLHLPDVHSPPGFPVRAADYEAHVRAAGIDKVIAALPKDPAARKKKLAQARKAIVDAPVSDPLRADIEARLAALPNADAGVVVRREAAAVAARGTEAVVDAIKQLWAAGIEQPYVELVVQLPVGEISGELRTEHPTEPSDEKNYTIRAGPERLVASWYDHTIRILERADAQLVFDKTGVHEPGNVDVKVIVTNTMALRLVDTARKLTKLFKRRLTIQWAFAGDQLYIVYVR